MSCTVGPSYRPPCHCRGQTLSLRASAVVAEAVEALHPATFVASSHTTSGWMLGGQDKGDVVPVKPTRLIQ